MMRERGLSVEHVTIFRWVQRYAPEINRRMRPPLKISGTSYRLVVFTREEVSAMRSHLPGTYGLIASLLYGSGLRLMEAVRLRVKDLDFARGEILVRDGKGEKDRRTILPRPLSEPLRLHLERVQLLHEKDLGEGFGKVYLPYALARKYPSAAR